MKKKKWPNLNFVNCPHPKWLAIINTKRRQLLTWAGMDNICWMNIHISSSFYTHVSKHQNNVICSCFCCVSNFTYKFIMRKKKPVWLDSPWITARRSSCCVSATMFSLQLCDLKWQQQRHQNRRGRSFLLASQPQLGFSSPFRQLSKSQPQSTERTNPTAPRRKTAGPPHLSSPPGEPGEART